MSHPVNRTPTEHPDWLLALGAVALVAFAYLVVWVFAILGAWMHGVGR